MYSDVSEYFLSNGEASVCSPRTQKRQGKPQLNCNARGCLIYQSRVKIIYLYLKHLKCNSLFLLKTLQDTLYRLSLHVETNKKVPPKLAVFNSGEWLMILTVDYLVYDTEFKTV